MRTVLVLGQSDRAEMRSLFAWLKRYIDPGHRWVIARDVEAAVGEFATDEFPDLIIVFQSAPNEYSPQDVNGLLAFAPLARVVVCYGAWCESDGRNLNLWPLSVRVPVWAARSRVEREWRLIQAAGQMPPLPWSASREEVFAFDDPAIEQALVPHRVLIDSPDSAYRQFLVERLAAEGHDIVTDSPSILMFDADPWGSARAELLQTLALRCPNAIIFALASLIQPTLEAELRDQGVHRVLPKLGASFNEIRLKRLLDSTDRPQESGLAT